MLVDYTGDFEMIGDIIFGEYEQSTAIKFKNIEHYESKNNSIDLVYNADDISSTGYIYK